MIKPKLLVYLLYGLTVPFAIACLHAPTNSIPLAAVAAEAVCMMALFGCIYGDRNTFDYRSWENNSLRSIFKLLMGAFMCYSASRVPESRIANDRWFEHLRILYELLAPYLKIASIALLTSAGLSLMLFSYLTIAGEMMRVSRLKAATKKEEFQSEEERRAAEERKLSARRKTIFLILFGILLFVLPFTLNVDTLTRDYAAGFFALFVAVLLVFMYALVGLIKMEMLNCRLWSRITGVIFMLEPPASLLSLFVAHWFFGLQDGKLGSPEHFFIANILLGLIIQTITFVILYCVFCYFAPEVPEDNEHTVYVDSDDTLAAERQLLW